MRLASSMKAWVSPRLEEAGRFSTLSRSSVRTDNAAFAPGDLGDDLRTENAK